METLTMTPNAHLNSIHAIKSLIDDFNLSKPDGTAEFFADVDFLVKGKRKVSSSLVKIIREKESYIITLLDRTFNAKFLPLEFKSGLQTFIYFVNEYLFIAGFNPNASIGSYTISISPKPPE
jgi:hypothetical protein